MTKDRLHPWLQAFLPHHRPVVRAWFGYAVSQGAKTPEAIVQVVQRLVSTKLEFSVSPTTTTLCEITLASLAHRRGEALAYAQTLLHH